MRHFRHQTLALISVLGFSVMAWAGMPRREWPARAAEVEAMRSFEREAQELEQARQRLMARAQAVFGEARERLHLTPEEGARLRFDGRASAFFLEDVAEVGSAR